MNKDFWKNFKKSIIALAPMDGYTDSAFRRICREQNPELVVFTEFTSAEGTSYGAEKVLERFRYHPSEQPVIAQIFGSDIESFIKTTKYLEDLGFSGIDINMGCPSKKIVKSEQGVALRKNPEMALRIIESVAQNTRLPVSVKTRLGWDNDEDLIAFGRGAYNAGANLLTIHGRTYCDNYSAPARFEMIYELKKQVPLVVIGNGGITSLADGKTKLGNLDGFMIGQAAWGNPWIFSGRTDVSFTEKVRVMRRHGQYLLELKGEKYGLLEFRKHLVCYIRGIQQASAHRLRILQAQTPDEIFSILDSIASEVQLSYAQPV